MASRRNTGKRAPRRARAASGVQHGELAAREMILQGAAVVFAQKGLGPPSVEDILGAAGVSRRTFYRLYKSKEEVAVALYRIGTDRLLESCRIATREESDPMRQFERCIDAHLDNAREFGRLVYVLGGDAQGRESLLHARRMEVHEILVSFLVAAVPAQRSIDSMVFRALIFALEGSTRIALEQDDEGRNVCAKSLERVRRVMRRITSATLAGEGRGVAPLPAAK